MFIKPNPGEIFPDVSVQDDKQKILTFGRPGKVIVVLFDLIDIQVSYKDKDEEITQRMVGARRISGMADLDLVVNLDLETANILVKNLNKLDPDSAILWNGLTDSAETGNARRTIGINSPFICHVLPEVTANFLQSNHIDQVMPENTSIVTLQKFSVSDKVSELLRESISQFLCAVNKKRECVRGQFECEKGTFNRSGRSVDLQSVAFI